MGVKLTAEPGSILGSYFLLHSLNPPLGAGKGAVEKATSWLLGCVLDHRDRQQIGRENKVTGDHEKKQGMSDRGIAGACFYLGRSGKASLVMI